MKQETVHELIKTRRAIRRYQDRPVSRDLIEKLLATAIWAPSAHNRQPWRFTVLLNDAPKHDLAVAMGEHLRRDRLRDGDDTADVEKDVARSYARIAGAPVVVVFFLTMEDMDSYPDTRRQWAEKQMAVQSVAMAVQNLWLLAAVEGLGACWLCAPLFVPELVRESLGVPEHWEAQGLLTLGWPAEKRRKTRRAWQEVTRFL